MMGSGGERGSGDPFEGLILDDEFVAGATISELPASKRVKRRKRTQRSKRAATKPKHNYSVPSSRPTRGRQSWTIAVFAALLFSIVVWNHFQPGAARQLSLQNAFSNDGSFDEVHIAGGQPPKGVEEASAPLGQPSQLARTSDAFEFMAMQSDGKSPVAYDPCRPIHIVVNSRTAPPEGEALLRESVNAVSAATGLQFVVDESTTESPTNERAAYQKDRYPGRWAPVLVAWSDPSESQNLAGEVAGVGGSAGLKVPKGAVYVSGTVTLDGPQLAEILGGPDGAAEVRGVIEHEFGHLVGLAHVDDTSQLMYERGQHTISTYADGDRTGLSQLGRGECFPDI